MPWQEAAQPGAGANGPEWAESPLASGTTLIKGCWFFKASAYIEADRAKFKHVYTSIPNFVSDIALSVLDSTELHIHITHSSAQFITHAPKHYTQPAAVSCSVMSQKKPSGQGVHPTVALPFEKVPKGHGMTVPLPGQ